MDNKNNIKLEEFKEIYSKMTVKEKKETLIFIIETFFNLHNCQQEQEENDNE